MTITRRTFLGAAVAVGLGACRDGGAGEDGGATSTTTTGASPSSTLPPEDFGEPTGPYPFGLGVASGDPDHESVVLWTWADREGAVTLEIALDAAFTQIIVRAPAIVGPEAGNTVRVLAGSLEPDTQYWYRFALDGHLTPPARTRTAPEPGAVPAEPLHLAQLSCQRYSDGYWTALADVAAHEPDVVVHCGDYVYEVDRGPVRPLPDEAPTDLDGYRALWRRYKAEPELQAAHAVAPWLVVWDDHEVENNYQGADPGTAGRDPAAFLDQRAAAYQAWWEFTPTRAPSPTGPDLRMHRTVDWGGLTRFVLLDTRQYRDDQPCPGEFGSDLGPQCDATPTVTMLGDEQEAWLTDVVERTSGDGTIWTTLVQQVVVHEWKIAPGNTVWNLDQWDGYTGARRRLLATLHGAPTPVVLTGDVHSSWVADLRDDGGDVGVEFVAPSVSSAIPDLLEGRGSLVELQSPHVQWSETERRGWVRHEITADRWTAEYRLVDDATVEGGAVTTVTTWVVEAGDRTVRSA